MDPLTLGLVMGGGGIAKSLLIDKPREDRQRMLAAETARYSPWTGMRPGDIQEADPFGSALQFGTTGAMLGQGMQDQKFKQSIWEKLANEPRVATGASPWNEWSVGSMGGRRY